MIITQSRVLVTFAAIIGVAIALFSSDNAELKNPSSLENSNSRSEAFLEKTRITTYDNEGFATILSSPSSQLFDEGLIKISLPNIAFESIDGKHVNATARDGILNSKKETLDLNGEVRIVQADDKNTLTLESEYFRLDNKDMKIVTDKAVSIRAKNIRINATGMEADINSRTLVLHSNVRGEYDF